jgi:hypothetical protein
MGESDTTPTTTHQCTVCNIAEQQGPEPRRMIGGQSMRTWEMGCRTGKAEMLQCWRSLLAWETAWLPLSGKV